MTDDGNAGQAAVEDGERWTVAADDGEAVASDDGGKWRATMVAGNKQRQRWVAVAEGERWTVATDDGDAAAGGSGRR